MAQSNSAVAFGLGLRDGLVDELLELDDPRRLDVLEVMIDDALSGESPRREAWAMLARRWPLIAHGTDLGIADARGLIPSYVSELGQALREVGVFWYSEHLAFVRTGYVEVDHFVPLLDGEDSLELLASNAATLRAALPCPLLLENPSDALGLGGPSGAARGELFAAALDRAEAAALLDLTNLVIDARNDGFSVAAYLDALPWELVVEVHLAGGRAVEGLWIDTHDRPVDREALELLGEVARRAPNLRAVILERDNDIPPLAALLDQLDEAREQVARARP